MIVDKEKIEQAISLLKEIEWLGFQENHTCINCGRNKANGHLQECRYAKALALLEFTKVEPEHVTRAKKTIAGWPEWKQQVNCNPNLVRQPESVQQEGFTKSMREVADTSPVQCISKQLVLQVCDYLDADRQKINYLTAENKAFVEHDKILQRALDAERRENNILDMASKEIVNQNKALTERNEKLEKVMWRCLCSMQGSDCLEEQWLEQALFGEYQSDEKESG